MISCDLECIKKTAIQLYWRCRYTIVMRTNIVKQNHTTHDTIWLTPLSHYSLPAAAASACAALFCAEHDPWSTSTGPENVCRFGGGMETVEVEVDQ